MSEESGKDILCGRENTETMNFGVDDSTLRRSGSFDSLGEEMDEIPNREPETTTLRVQAACSSNNEVLTRFLTEFTNRLESSVGHLANCINTIVAGLSQRIDELQAQKQDQTQVLNRPVSVPQPNPSLSNLNLGAVSPSVSMDVDCGPSIVPSNHSTAQVSSAPEFHMPGPLSRPVDTYRARKVDSVRFRPLDAKLDVESNFKYWRRGILSQIESMECTFVVDPNVRPPSEFTASELEVAVNKVKNFMLDSLAPYFQDLVYDMTSPLEIIEKLKTICDPTSHFQLRRLVDEFNSFYYDPQAERAINFITRFNETHKKLASIIHPDMLTDIFVKVTFENAIRETLTFQKAELNSSKFSLSELKELLADEQLRADQSAQGSSMMFYRNTVVSTRGRGGGKRGRSSGIPGKTPNTPPSQTTSKFCSNCRKKGHARDFCYRANKLCFACGGPHNLAQCRRQGAGSGRSIASQNQPPKATVNKSSRQNTSYRPKPLTRTDHVKPKLFRLPLGQARHLAEELSRNPNSIFTIASSTTDVSDTEDVWVVMGAEEQKCWASLSSVNYVSERPHSGNVLHVSDNPSAFTAIVDTGCTEHLTNNKEILTNFRPLPQTRIFKCANGDDSADISVSHCGEITFRNNNMTSTLNNVLYNPQLSSNLFSVRKLTQVGLSVVFSKDKVEFVQPATGQVLKTGYFRNNLWWVDLPLAPADEGFSKPPKNTCLRRQTQQVDSRSNHQLGNLCQNSGDSLRSVNFSTCRKSSSEGVGVGGSFQAFTSAQLSHVAHLGGRKSGKSVRRSSMTDLTPSESGPTQVPKLKFPKLELGISAHPVSMTERALSESSTPTQPLKSPNSIPLTLPSPQSRTSSKPTESAIARFDQLKLEKEFPSMPMLDVLWHLRLNHASRAYLNAAKRFLPELKHVKFTDRILNCEYCHEANTKRKSHSSTRHRSDKPFAMLHSDIMGKISPANFRSGDVYIIIFVCDYSRYTFAYMLKNKREVHIALRRCLRQIEALTSQKRSVFRLRSDHGLEYQTHEMKQLLSEEGITWTPGQPHSPELNGVAERVNQELKNKIRVNLLSAKMPPGFWGHSLQHVVFVANRMPHSSNLFLSPFEVVHGYPPNLKYMKRFGCLVHYVDYHQKSKFAPNAKKGYLLECTETGIVLFSEQLRTLVNSCDVKFIETIVYGDRVKDYPMPLCDILNLDGDNDLPESIDDLCQDVAALQRDVQSEYVEPLTYQEALESPESELWESAIRSELQSLQEMGTWDLVPKSSLPPNSKVIKSRWVHKRKIEPDGSLRYKSRLVIKGYADTNRYLISEIFAPVARLTDVRVFLSVVNKLGLTLHQLDVTTAFLHGDLEKPVYMHVPEGLELAGTLPTIDEPLVCKLKRSLYGLKVSPNLWYRKFSKILTSLGFVTYPFQSCIFKWEGGKVYVILIIYVDDCLLASNDNHKALEIIEGLQKEIRIKNLGAPKKFLGFEIERDENRKWIFLHQRSMIEKLIDKYLDPEEGTAEIPMMPTSCTLHAQLQESGDSGPSPNVPFREVIGSLLYIQNGTRPDISFSVNFLSRKQVGYTLADWKCVIKILKYLKGTLNFGIMFAGQAENILAYTDASLGTSDLKGKSTTGFLIKCLGDVVSWKSKKQSHVSLSTCEAEYIAMSDSCKELVSVRSLCKFLINIDMLPTLRCDCAPAISVAMTNDSKTLKHVVKLCMHYVHELYKSGDVHIEWTSTKNQLADTFTKALPRDKFIEFRSIVMCSSDALF